MIDTILWNYFSKGWHLVIFMGGSERKYSSGQIEAEFSLGQLKRVG